MNTSAPRARLVDALSGEKAPDRFFKALSEADNFVREIDSLRELQCRIAELEAENRELKQQLAAS